MERQSLGEIVMCNVSRKVADMVDTSAFFIRPLFAVWLCVISFTVMAGNQPVAIKFKAVVGDAEFSCGKSYDDIGITKSRITPSDFRFYISEIELIDNHGNFVPLELDQDGIWQYRNLVLLDFEDGTGPCRNGNIGLHDQVSGKVPKGKYRGIRFTLGVPFNLNHGDPTIALPPLNLSSMFWTWQSGYRFLKIDMASTGQPQGANMKPERSMQETVEALEKLTVMRNTGLITSSPTITTRKPQRSAGFSVHLGSTDCASASFTSAPTECKNPNRLTVTFEGFVARKNIIVADLASLLRDANVDVNAMDTAPGCMSFNDADCPGVFMALGLPYNGQPAVAQSFFSMR